MLLKPQHLLLGLAGAICVLEFIRTLIWGDDYAMDISWHETFYIFSSFHIVLVFTLLFLGMASLYKMGAQSRFQYNKWLTLGHFVSVCLFIITFYKLTQVGSITSIPRRYYSFDNFDPMVHIYEQIDFLNKCLLIFALLVVIFFVLNLIMGYLKRNKE